MIDAIVTVAPAQTCRIRHVHGGPNVIRAYQARGVRVAIVAYSYFLYLRAVCRVTCVGAESKLDATRER